MVPNSPGLLLCTGVCAFIFLIWFALALGAAIEDWLGFFQWLLQDVTLAAAAYFVCVLCSKRKDLSLRKICCITCPCNIVLGVVSKTYTTDIYFAHAVHCWCA